LLGERRVHDSVADSLQRLKRAAEGQAEALTAPLVTRLWDYGWLHRNRVKLAGASSDTALIEQYVTSPAFQTSFLPNDKDETGIHGPFVAERITAADFVPLRESELGHYLESVQLSDTPGVDVAERAKVVPHLRAAFQGDRRCYVLSRDERNRELFHDWGFVLSVFREFLFVGPERDDVDRFVIGYD
jgi:hypothetical protein